MRLHTQIGLLLGTLVLAMGVFTLLYFPSQQDSVALNAMEQKASTNSAIIARAAAATLDSLSLDSTTLASGLHTVAQIAREDSDIAYLRIFNSDGEEMASRLGTLEDSVVFSDREKYQTKFDSDVLHVTMPVFTVRPIAPANGEASNEGTRQIIGAIQLGFTLDRLQQQILKDQKVSAWVVAAIIVLAVLLAIFFGNMLTEPLEALAQVVLAFGQGDDNVRARVAGPYEIRRLGVVFNNMADALEEGKIDDREKAAELAAANEARANVEAKFRQAFENAPIGMGLLDADGKLFDANPALKGILQKSSDDSQDLSLLNSIEEGDRERFVALLNKVLKSEYDSINDKFSCNNASGETLQIVVNISAVRSDTGDFLYSVLQMQDVTESAKLTNQLEYQASYDELTGLLNRRSFEAELTKALEQSSLGTDFSFLLFMDLDQFKIVNDTSGHAAGDRLLRNIADILSDNVRGNDAVCRLGGDEFGIILWKCSTEVAAKISESIRASIESMRFKWENETYHLGVSIGGLPIDHATGDASELQQLADAACYAAKEAGRNRVHMVGGENDSARAHRGEVRWVQRLREAMDSNQFSIYQQVIRPLQEQPEEPERLEILLRLRDPKKRKLIPPGAFLPAAERYGMALELDQWVVRKLLDTVFVHQSIQAEHRSYWINLSGMSIGDPKFAEYLVNAIGNSPLPPGTINFEITESAAMRSVVDARNLMLELRGLGCQFALDDFGSGLSSFGYLEDFPIEYLKIDGTFVRDLLNNEANQIFVKSIIDIAHALNIKTIAEFVENDEILETVRELGADYAQGFAVGRPVALAPQFPTAPGVGAVSAEFRKASA